MPQWFHSLPSLLRETRSVTLEICSLPVTLIGVMSKECASKPVAKIRVFDGIRTFSSFAVGIAILLSTLFGFLFQSESMGWQVVIALLALAIGIPHGALDHLVTLPRSRPLKMVLFILVYIAIALIAVWAILEWNVYGFYLVVAMSALHFGIGDAAFLAERDRILGRERSPRLAQVLYALAGGVTPVVIPLVNERSSQALAAVNPTLIDWDGGLADLFYWVAIALLVTAIVAQLVCKRERDALDLILLGLLAILSPPLIAFAVYFGTWHAMRHTARLTLNLRKSQDAYERGDAPRALRSAVIPGTPALFGTLIVAAGLVLFGENNFSDDFLWLLLVVIWALTVPHMMVTAKLDRGALL
jgi:Brp/Blh family beta-carotene 15,15'-monooxygenase